VEVLKSVDLVLAEDTRVTKKLFSHYDIDTPLRAYHSHNEHGTLDNIVSHLKGGQTVALVSDAGTPGISDPGFLLSRACHQNQITVTCLPGASALLPALVSSGLPCDKFHFEGFLPHKKGRKTRLLHLSTLPNTFAIYESPHRLIKCLEQLIEVCGAERKACVCRELSKLHEEVITTTLDDLLIAFSDRPSIKGEIVIVVEGSTKK